MAPPGLALHDEPWLEAGLSFEYRGHTGFVDS
jgi:hypothetical protein